MAAISATLGDRVDALGEEAEGRRRRLEAAVVLALHDLPGYLALHFSPSSPPAFGQLWSGGDSETLTLVTQTKWPEDDWEN